MKRSLSGALLLAGFAFLGGRAFSDAPQKHAPFAGTWMLDSSKSQVADARDVTVTIDFSGDVIKVAMAVKKGEATSTSQFACDTGSGAECVFNEPGHKSKASVYFAGDVLNVWKSEGPPNDVSAQWKGQVAPDGKALTLTISHLEPAAKDEVLVFQKK